MEDLSVKQATKLFGFACEFVVEHRIAIRLFRQEAVGGMSNVKFLNHRYLTFDER